MGVHIYGLVDPRTNLLRYVGKSKEPHKRLVGHLSEASREVHHRAYWLKTLLRAGLVPTVTILETVDETGWQAVERWWIAWFRALGANLVNDTDGGDGGDIHPEARARAVANTPPSKGKKLTEEHKRKISIAHIGISHPISAEQAETQRQFMTGRKASEETKRKMAAARRAHWVGVSPEERSAIGKAARAAQLSRKPQ